MRYEDALLYLCCTQELTPQRLEQITGLIAREPLDWAEVYSLAYHHGVAPLVYLSLLAADAAGAVIPTQTLGRFKMAGYGNLLAKQSRHQTLLRALDYFQSHGLEVMAVKGLALDLLVYDQFWYTHADDVDLILRPARADIPVPALSQVQEDMQRLGIRGVEYEFYQHHDVNLNETLPIDFETIWQGASVHDFQGHRLYLMQPEDMLLAVCINSCRKRYFRLRSLCDIAETIKRFPDLDWSLFVRKAIAYECNNIVYSALSVTEATVGCALPEGLRQELGVGTFHRQVVDALVHHLLQRVPLSNLSFYEGREAIGRKVGWSLVLLYATYRWGQRYRKLQEAVNAWTRAPLHQI